MSLAHWVYRLLVWALCPLLLAWLWWRGRREPGYRQRWHERLGRMEVDPGALHGVVVHMASVGESRAAQPLIEMFLRDFPSERVTLSGVTPTGAATLKNLWGQRVRQVLWPVDTMGACREFLDRLQPRLLVLVERELWPEMLAQCRLRGIAVAVVNGRLSERSVRTYQKWHSLMRPVWSQLALVACADEADAQRFAALGVPPSSLKVSGNLKFDVPASAPICAPAELTGRLTVIAGSTHAPEEHALLQGWGEFKRAHPQALLVIAPRHPQRFDEVADLLAQHRMAFQRRSAQAPIATETDVLLLDTMGELATWYAWARVAFVGGSLAPVGGHNPMEALRHGVPTAFGPHTAHFEPLCDRLCAQGGGLRVADAAHFWREATRLCQDPSAHQQMGQQALAFFHTHTGATQRTWSALRAWLPPVGPSKARQMQANNCTLWYDPDWLPHARPQDLEADPHAVTSGSPPAEHLAGGRGQAQRVIRHGQPMLWRHYRRGGLMARLSQDRFVGCAPHCSRALREWALLQHLRACGLPVPVPVAARQVRHLGCYTADILVGWIPDARNVAQWLSTSPLTATQWHTLGTAIRRLHQHGVYHADLNCHNLMLDAQGQAWIVDFDKCELRGPGDWIHANLLRLQRSLRKERRNRPVFHWQEADWDHLLKGYGQ